MKITKATSFNIQICIAGNKEDAVRACRELCFSDGLCVTVTDAEYVYTGGMESGVVVGLINYPRFPKSENELIDIAEKLGIRLMDRLYQQSFCIVTPKETHWYSRRLE